MLKMPMYVLATRLSHDLLMKQRKEVQSGEVPGKKWLDAVKEKIPEVKFHAHYFVLGPYDFLDIFEAPNEEIAAKVSLITQTMGATLAQTWTIMNYSDYKKLLSEL